MFFRESTVYCPLSDHSCGSRLDGRKQRNVTTSADSMEEHCCLPAWAVDGTMVPSRWAPSPQTLLNHSWQFSLSGRAEGDNPEPVPPLQMEKGWKVWLTTPQTGLSLLDTGRMRAA